jgi:hypothetical protein
VSVVVRSPEANPRPLHLRLRGLEPTASYLLEPAELSDGARAQYTAYLRERIGKALSFAMGEKDMRGFKMLLDLGTPDAQTLETALNEARDLRLTEATAMLLERRRGAPGARRMRKFEL